MIENKQFICKFIKKCKRCRCVSVISNTNSLVLDMVDIKCLCLGSNYKCYFFKNLSTIDLDNEEALGFINLWNYKNG